MKTVPFRLQVLATLAVLAPPVIFLAASYAALTLTLILLAGVIVAVLLVGGPLVYATLGSRELSRGRMGAMQEELCELRSVSAALDKSMGVIEFQPDGTIITANANFLAVVGYALEEIRGKHHRMFAEPVFAASAEYRAFWEKLGRGEFDAGEYMRIGKGGREVWIQATYNPIKDANGRVYKVVKFASDITERKARDADTQGQIAAIYASMAAIEFNLDGTIIKANDNFLGAVGYTLDEIKGRHHRIFVDPAYAASDEYRQFWENLNRGEFDTREYKRFGKGGREIWIQASYNPIRDANGRVYKVVKFASDITAQKQYQLSVERLLQDTRTVMGYVASGDLTQTLEGSYTGEFAQLADAVAHTVENLTRTITQIKGASDAINTAAREIAAGNTNLSQRTEEQASSLEETASSMEQITSTVKQSADNARQANQLAQGASTVATQGGERVREVVVTMDAITESSRKISEIITVIDGIAFQTNILALNAAVEAARAGEQGRGFAVVASEVRNLAQRSASAAKEIKTLINDSVATVEGGSKLVQQAGSTMEEIVSAVKRVTDIITEISAASDEQAQGIEQVSGAIAQMDEVTQQNAALVEESAATATLLEDQANALVEAVAAFRIREGAQQLLPRPR